MNNKERKAVFFDLYDLYKEGELEGGTLQWMKEHEPEFGAEAENRKRQNEHDMKPPPGDIRQIKYMKCLTYGLYGFFIVLSIWMTVWFYF
ncbi:hypothetical protein CHH79_01890 [Bacillus siamensis]|uniref:hypothetical protein n=1 Tax=Bacillus TaxID=1386 RepID=UPI0003191E53|nr:MULTISPECIES: hypothetical protein [Bacillus]MDU0813001.1 hypothetical protein [Bacillus siamensis]MED0772910.1 hypothetical protein [Bacillus siamensis]MED0775955.1 hypothetical protein [Bacillus siamensis]MED0778664.1 hypothetical protein [Bacillus siamensis]MED0835521.1 hypothetical protein [Bacillus siamensis]